MPQAIPMMNGIALINLKIILNMSTFVDLEVLINCGLTHKFAHKVCGIILSLKIPEHIY